MKFEVLKRSHVKRNILIAAVIVFILSAIILSFTQAKYRTTESIPLIQGTINFSPSDFNIVAMYLNQDGAIPAGETDIAPKFGYTLNEEQSFCEVNDEKIDNAAFTYESGLLGFYNLNRKGTKCSVYFDLIPDSEKPTLSILTSSTDTSITVTANATDNIGIYYYYYKIDNGEEIRLEENSYTFEGLEKDSVHTITVRAVDAAGNEVNTSKEVTVGLNSKDVILAHYSTILTRTNFSSTMNNTTTGTIYKSSDESQYDNDGEVYYFAGKPTDNWFQFGTDNSGKPLYWRIIRINGNGSIRLIYNGTSTSQTGDSTMINVRQAFNSSHGNNMYVGYMYQNNQVHGLTTSSSIKNTIDNWYINNLTDKSVYLDGDAGFCGDRTPSTSSNESNGQGGTGATTTYYGAYIRLVNSKKPSFKCSDTQDLYTTPGSNKGNKALKTNNNIPTPIGLITADEIVFAGGSYNKNNSSYYLCNNTNYWTMSPYGYSYASVFYMSSSGSLGNNEVNLTAPGIRPVINLRGDLVLTGSGTVSDPFIVVS